MISDPSYDGKHKERTHFDMTVQQTVSQARTELTAAG
jgi:hypothetical protein